MLLDFDTRSLITNEPNRAFSEAIRFTTVVSLAKGSSDSKNMSLHSLCARISVGSGKTLFDFGRGRIHWTIISLVSLLLFTIQTTAYGVLLSIWHSLIGMTQVDNDTYTERNGHTILDPISRHELY